MKAFLLVVLLATIAYAEPIRIACLGNSITAGAGIPDPVNDSWPGQLQKLLGDAYQVGNFGNSGRTLLRRGDYPLWVEKEFKNALAMNPNIVIISLGTNDSKPYNWVYKDEFIPDYLAMIDTFKTCPANPQFYICKPPPAFSVRWDIRDSVIVAEIIPMIEQVAELRGASVIDFYTPMADKRNLFPDDIHPDSEGSWEMAKIVYYALTGKSVESAMDEDVAAGKPVTGEGLLNPAEMLVDGDRRTAFWCADGGHAVVDLGELISIDMFQTDFGFEGRKYGARYTIDISKDGLQWQTVVDQSARMDTTQIAVDAVAPVEARFVRLTLLGRSSTPAIAPTVYDFKVLKTAKVHAPVITYKVTDVRPQYVKIDVEVTASCKAGEYIKLFTTTDPNSPMTVAKDYRKFETQVIKSTIKPNQIRWYWAKAYYEGLEIGGVDTLKLTYESVSAVQEHNQTPSSYRIANYPNPFNPSTTIRCELPEPAIVTVQIYDVQGRLVYSVPYGRRPAGTFAMVWNGVDLSGHGMPSGVYWLVLRTDRQVAATQKMVLLK